MYFNKHQNSNLDPNQTVNNSNSMSNNKYTNQPRSNQSAGLGYNGYQKSEQSPYQNQQGSNLSGLSTANSTIQSSSTSTNVQTEDYKDTKEKSIDTNQKQKRGSKQKSAKNSVGGLGAGFLGGLISSFIFFSLALVVFIYFSELSLDDFSSIIRASEGLENKQRTSEIIRETTNLQIVNEDSEVIETVQKTDESVVSIIISRDLQRMDSFFGLGTSSNNVSIPTQVGAGTGFIVSKEGYIITNRHVVNVPDASYTVVFSDGQMVEAEILDKDSVLDIAVLRIEVGDRELRPLPIGDSSNIQVGQTVLAIGNSLGRFGNSISRGIVSGLDRNVLASDGRGGATEMLTNVIQTDASINPGNSGGPLLDIQGNVVGVNVARAEADNVAFAIPINDVKIVLETVITTGRIQRPFIGIRYRDITPEISQRNNLEIDFGVIIISQDGQPGVTPGSPAEEVGLQEGDIILKLDGKRIDRFNPLPSILGNYRVGDEVNLTILRGLERTELKLTLGIMNTEV